MPATALDAIEHRVDQRAQLVERVAGVAWPARAIGPAGAQISRTVSVRSRSGCSADQVSDRAARERR